MATEPPNPYAPSAALAHEEAAKEAEVVGSRRPSRLGAVVLGLLAHPALGAGHYILRRPRRFAFWASIGVACWMLTLIGVWTAHAKLTVFALVGLYALLLWSLADTLMARAGAAAHPAARAWLVAIALIVTTKGAGVATRQWLVEAFQMPSGSMVPALLVGDHMFVRKGHSSVARGDVIVFEFPQDRSIDYVKRVVAVGGDVVEVTGGIVSINGVALTQDPIPGRCSYQDEGSPTPEAEEPCTLVRETNAGRAYTIMFTPDHAALDFPRMVIPEGQVFVLGDNRDNSYDSRKWGTVPVDLIKGTATVIWWSRGPGTGVRWSRVGHGIE